MMMKSIPALIVVSLGLTFFTLSETPLGAQEKTAALQITRAGMQPSRAGQARLIQRRCAHRPAREHACSKPCCSKLCDL